MPSLGGELTVASTSSEPPPPPQPDTNASTSASAAQVLNGVVFAATFITSSIQDLGANGTLGLAAAGVKIAHMLSGHGTSGD